ncbi:sigma-54-dependent transcriptional regulator [Noviherbaspirillum galbum]|uniref:Sigma-54-dependent Fis family transcriptional regulator n=1 Tax=Noviherbaspirillum galbum TaxID=2709383 RepID=A0A6B3SP37_9BURK|nr:sigma-54 dependent transcriptional regulator [Noviherbaspirillum galbum]NEX59479.1 sigma-54-dependent Fis family transcriptional regulator [Noviherbaspirillum galbum]
MPATAPSIDILLVEDEEAVRLATCQMLELDGYRVRACHDAEEALRWLHQASPTLLITDVRLPGASGLSLLESVMRIDATLPVILVTGHGDVSMAVEAMRIGACDFIEKPFPSERLLDSVRRACEKRRLYLENQQLKAAWANHPDMPALIGQSAAMEAVRAFIRSIGPTDVDVLVNGQTGTGKEVVARQLHVASGRKGPFVAINCGALPESVFESEVFGHEAGAFTSAQKRRIGKLEHANGGTLFLDEIESMPLALQVKLLRVLQERRLERLGSNDAIPIDCRVIAASKADLRKLSDEGGFREDLYYRISVVAIDLPRLADRPDDIPHLLSHFVQIASMRFQRPAPAWSDFQMQQWQAMPWPGNVRELRNFADRLVLGVATAVPGTAATAATPSLSRKVEQFERAVIIDALARTKGNVAAAAEALEIPKTTLYDKLKKYGIGAEK